MGVGWGGLDDSRPVVIDTDRHGHADTDIDVRCVSEQGPGRTRFFGHRGGGQSASGMARSPHPPYHSPPVSSPPFSPSLLLPAIQGSVPGQVTRSPARASRRAASGCSARSSCRICASSGRRWSGADHTGHLVRPRPVAAGRPQTEERGPANGPCHCAGRGAACAEGGGEWSEIARECGAPVPITTQP